MLGWLIIVSRCEPRAVREARGDADAIRQLLIETTGSADVPESSEERIATWQAGPGGVEWLGRLVRLGRAVATSHAGYPNAYLILCQDVVTLVEAGLPNEYPVWSTGPHDILTDRWLGRTTINHDRLARLDRNEWLLVNAWDES